MLAAQPRKRSRRRAENAATLIAISFTQSFPHLLRNAQGARRIFVTNQQQGERHERRKPQISSVANLLVVEAAKILGARMSQRVVMRVIGLNQNSTRQITTSGAPGDLSYQLKRSFGGTKIRQG